MGTEIVKWKKIDKSKTVYLRKKEKMRKMILPLQSLKVTKVKNIRLLRLSKPLTLSPLNYLTEKMMKI